MELRLSAKLKASGGREKPSLLTGNFGGNSKTEFCWRTGKASRICVCVAGARNAPAADVAGFATSARAGLRFHHASRALAASLNSN